MAMSSGASPISCEAYDGPIMQGTWDEAAGLKYLRVEPDGAPADLPLIVCMHGRGADPNDLSSLALELHPDGYRWLFPQGPLTLQFAPGMVGYAWYSLGDER